MGQILSSVGCGQLILAKKSSHPLGEYLYLKRGILYRSRNLNTVSLPRMILQIESFLFFLISYYFNNFPILNLPPTSLPKMWTCFLSTSGVGNPAAWVVLHSAVSHLLPLQPVLLPACPLDASPSVPAVVLYHRAIQDTVFCCLVTKSGPVLLQPHEPKHARLLCPWDFPGNNTGVGYHHLPS